jgi:hypothetical protein
MNPSIEVLKSMARLSGTPDFDRVIHYLVAERIEKVNDLIHATNPVLVHQAQGYVSALDDFLQCVSAAPTALANLG